MTFINYDDFSFCFYPPQTTPLWSRSRGGGWGCLSGLEPQQQSPSPRPRWPALPQPPAWTRKLRTPEPRPHVPQPSPGGSGERRTAAGQRDSQRDSDKHTETPREPGRDAHREMPRQRQTGCRDIFRETRRQGQAELHPETWRTPEGCASHVHTGAYTGPHSLHRDALYLRRGCADSLQQSRVTTSPEGRGSASAHHARKGVSYLYDGGSLWPVVANPLHPGLSVEP